MWFSADMDDGWRRKQGLHPAQPSQRWMSLSIGCGMIVIGESIVFFTDRSWAGRHSRRTVSALDLILATDSLMLSSAPVQLAGLQFRGWLGPDLYYPL